MTRLIFVFALMSTLALGFTAACGGEEPEKDKEEPSEELVPA